MSFRYVWLAWSSAVLLPWTVLWLAARALSRDDVASESRDGALRPDRAAVRARVLEPAQPVAVAKTLQQALLIAFFELFPLMFLSGTIVPIDTMPAALQVLSLASPIRHYMEIALGIVLKGVGLATLWPQFAGLAAIAGALALLGLRRLRRHLYA